MVQNTLCKMILFAICNLSILSMVVYADTQASEKEIAVILRYDDYSKISPTELETKILDVLKSKNISCTFGVIPYLKSINNALPQAKADILRKAIKTGTVEVALHGFDHLWGRDGVSGEFEGLSYNRQVEKIEKGRGFLQRILDAKITTFIPPFNRYDQNTIRALEKLQFICISGDCWGPQQSSSSLKFLPVTCELNEVRDAVESARHIRGHQSAIAVMFHPFYFVEVDKKRGKISYQEFVDLLSWLASQRDIRVTSIREAITPSTDFSAKRYSTFRSYFKVYMLIPPTIRKLFKIPSGVFLSTHEASDGKALLWLLVLIIYSAILLISFYVSFFIASIIFPMSRLLSYVSGYGCAAILLLILIHEFRDMELGPNAASGIVFLMGVLGACVFHMRLKKKGRLML